MLFASGMPDLVVPIQAGRPKIGSSVLGVGYSGGLELRFGIGRIRALHDYDDDAVIQTDAVFDSGRARRWKPDAARLRSIPMTRTRG